MDLIEAILEQRDRERRLPVIGSPERPYELIVPGWMEDRYVALGTSAQEAADELFCVAVKVTVVR